MKYWLMKSEPDVYSIEHLAAEPNQTDYWDGIRNYQARNFIRDDMQIGDMAFFYHSRCDVPGIVGTMRIVKQAYPDPTAFVATEKYYDPKSDPDNPRWFMVDVQLVETFPRVVSLSELKADPALSAMKVVQRGNRLSITPVTADQWAHIVALV